MKFMIQASFFRKHPAPGVLALAAFAVMLSILAAGTPATPVNAIDQILADASSSAIYGVYVQDLTTGQVLYDYNGDKGLLPASTQKLLTTATALQTFGADFRYRTVLYFNGKVEGNVLRGDLIIKGSGDPSFGSIETGGGDPLQRWAQEIAKMGIRRIDGRIIGDDNVFDDKPYAEGWDIEYLTSQASRVIGVGASGLSYRDNVVEIRMRSGNVGQAPGIETFPSGYSDIRNEAVTADRGRGSSVETYRDMVNEVIVLRGSLPRSADATIAIPVANPTRFTLFSFAGHLKQSGIDVRAQLFDIDNLTDKVETTNAQPLMVHVSAPLQHLLAITNKESNNFYAEQLFRTFAWGGSQSGGESRVRQMLASGGIDAGTLTLFDGSGLSRKNIVTPKTMVGLLGYMYKQPSRNVFLTTLARSGEGRTTMSGRLGGANVYAKTGSLEYVRALSGYAWMPDGRPVAFAIMANNFTGSSHAISHTIDQIVLSLTGQPAS